MKMNIRPFREINRRKTKVVSVGNGRSDNKGNVTPLTLKKGDKILFSKYGGNELSVGGEDLMIMEETDVLAIIG